MEHLTSFKKEQNESRLIAIARDYIPLDLPKFFKIYEKSDSGKDDNVIDNELEEMSKRELLLPSNFNLFGGGVSWSIHSGNHLYDGFLTDKKLPKDYFRFSLGCTSYELQSPVTVTTSINNYQFKKLKSKFNILAKHRRGFEELMKVNDDLLRAGNSSLRTEQIYAKHEEDAKRLIPAYPTWNPCYIITPHSLFEAVKERKLSHWEEIFTPEQIVKGLNDLKAVFIAG